MTALFDTGANMSIISQKIFNSLPQKPKLLKLNTCAITSTSGTDLGPIGQCYLKFKLGNKYLILDLILGLNWLLNYNIGCHWNINGH